MDHDLIMFFLAIHQPHRIKVIENTLMNRRTVSTLFWGMRYQINDFMGLLPKLNPQQTLVELQKMIKPGLVLRLDENRYQLTAAGAAWIHKRLAFIGPSISCPMNVQFNLLQFRQRFLLATQMVSEFSHHNRHYYPMLINDAENQSIKKWFHAQKGPQLISEFQDLLMSFLTPLSNERAWQFGTLLNGYAVTGWTIDQQALALHHSVGSLILSEWALFNDLIQMVVTNPQQYVGINALLQGTRRQLVSRSAQQTYQLLLQGASLPQITHRRNLKPSTIKEHLLEIAILQPQTHAMLRRHFTAKLWKQLKFTYHGDLDQWQFSQIQQSPLDCDYFTFRLFQILRSYQLDG